MIRALLHGSHVRGRTPAGKPSGTGLSNQVGIGQNYPGPSPCLLAPHVLVNTLALGACASSCAPCSATRSGPTSSRALHSATRSSRCYCITLDRVPSQRCGAGFADPPRDDAVRSRCVTALHQHRRVRHRERFIARRDPVRHPIFTSSHIASTVFRVCGCTHNGTTSAAGSNAKARSCMRGCGTCRPGSSTL